MVGKRRKKHFKAVTWELLEAACDAEFSKWVSKNKLEKDVNKMYESLCSTVMCLAEKTIPKKTICVHSKRWWNKESGDLSKIKKAERMFNKRSNETNYNRYTSIMSKFKDLEKSAKINT